MNGLGLVTMMLGIQMALQTQNILIVMGSVLVGGALGEWWRIEDGLKALGNRIEARVGNMGGLASGERSITQAFVTTSLVYCVGPLTIVGSILDGLTGNYQPLAIKSMLDGFASLAFGASLGPGVLFSSISLLVYQGGLTLAAYLFGSGFSGITAETPAVIELSATGGVLIIGISLVLLNLKPVRVGNFLPATLIAPVIVLVLEHFNIAF